MSLSTRFTDGDPYYSMQLPAGGQQWVIGIDDSDGDRCKLLPAANPSVAGTRAFSADPTTGVMAVTNLSFDDHVSTLSADGQVWIGAAGGVPTPATITAGTAASVVNAANSITIGVDGTVATTYTCDGASSATPAANNLNILGTAAQGISTAGAGSTVTLTIQDATDALKGVVELATGAEVTTGTDTSRPVVPSTLTTKLGAQTLHGVPYGGGAGTNLSWLGEASDGQLIIGQTGGVPVLATLTAGAGIGIANAAGSITISNTGGVASTFTAEDATTCTPAAGNTNFVGTGTNGISTTAAGNTMTILMDSPYADGDFSFESQVGGATRILTVQNTVDQANSEAEVLIQVAGGLSYDAYVEYGIAGTKFYSTGIDNSQSDIWKLTTDTASTDPSSGTTMMEVNSTTSVKFYRELQFDGVSAGYTGSEEHLVQAAVQTTDAVQSTLWSLTLAANQAITVEARICAPNSTHGAMVGGNLLVCARRAGAGAALAQAPVVNVLEDAAGAPTFTADVNGNDVRIRITGEAGTTYNWVGTIRYHLVNTNA